MIDKICHFCPNFGTNWRLPSLNGHSSAHRGAIDPGPFSTAREFPADDFRHWKCLKSPFQAWLIRVQSSHTKRHFWAIFGRTPSFYWFSLFLLPLSRFWPISFEPPLENPRLRPVGLVRLGSTSKAATAIHYLPLRGKFPGSINEHVCSYFYLYSDKTQIISQPMRIEHTNPNSKSQSEILYVLTGLL